MKFKVNKSNNIRVRQINNISQNKPRYKVKKLIIMKLDKVIILNHRKITI